ncbi:hypothetical protein [Macrococcus lamae]|uniref:Nuclear transport factor 2 family protein n=1 Tax=Macrococcus lamae TaxID=198484 RepID=A0A4R6BT86_9STAP|nr:hypothetical protein [Macrococcus lamae]TDM07705.1 hypothetical protein ERX29_08155 [Macrococcus lamae]
MSHLDILMACQNKDVTLFKKLLHEDVVMTITGYNNYNFTGDYNDVVEVLNAEFKDDYHAEFEVFNQVERDSENVIFIKVSREQINSGDKDNAVWVLTCDKNKTEHYLRKIHVEVVEMDQRHFEVLEEIQTGNDEMHF